jgi:hypothetical protein
MRSARAPLVLNRFDLLPPSFHYHDRVRQVICSWLTIICMLSVTLCAVAVATLLRKHRVHRANVRLAAAAIPLMDLRRDVIRLQQDNNQRNQWCQWVDSARPDDSVLQTLAAVAFASQSETDDIVIDALHLRMPIEFSATAKATPAWAIPHVSVSARITNSDMVDRWVNQLNAVDRIEAASMVVNDRDSKRESLQTVEEINRVELTATPLATRVLP